MALVTGITATLVLRVTTMAMVVATDTGTRATTTSRAVRGKPSCCSSSTRRERVKTAGDPEQVAQRIELLFERVGDDLADDRPKLEAVTASPTGQKDAPRARSPIDHEVTIGRDVHTDTIVQEFAGAGQAFDNH
jgi:hypothetical protein